MEKSTKLLERWWQMPLLVSQRCKLPWTFAMTLLAVLFMLPLPATAADSRQDHEDWYTGWDFELLNNTSIRFKVIFWDDYGTEEGWCTSDGLIVKASKDNGNSYQEIGRIKTSRSGGLTLTGSLYKASRSEGNPWWYSKYREAVQVQWDLPLQYRNCNIKIKCEGKWCDYDGDNQNSKSKTWSCTSSYAFSVRSISWNGNINISPDGTVTVPYKFGGACNTDGDTHIFTSINNSENGTIGYRSPGNYAAGSYTFNLYNIGMKMTSTFTIEPYHEFTHYNDKDANNGQKKYSTKAGSNTFSAMPVANITEASFQQSPRTITLKWNVSNRNFETGDWGTKWVIYRDGNKIGAVSQNVRSFVDTGFENETKHTYTIYYVWKNWNEDTKVSDLKSNDYSVTPNRTMPINNMNVDSRTSNDRLIFTWNSDSYPKDWGHKFKIFIDNELAYTIVPSDGQTSYRWEHRATDKHSDRQSFVSNGIPYTEEPLHACVPHNYRVESYIGDKKFSEVRLDSRAIGSGTHFYSLTSTKGAYPGYVKLAWHVDLQGSTLAKKYVVDRRRAEKESEDWVNLTSFASTEEYLSFTDDTPLPGVYYDYRVSVIDKCDNGSEIKSDITDIGFAQTTGTISGRITYGSTGMAVAGADVEAKRTGQTDNNEAQYHAIRFTDISGFVTWQYPDANYAKNKFQNGDYSMQMWIYPEEFSNQWIARLKGDNRGAIGIGGNGELLYCCGTSPQYNFNTLKLKQGEYNHVTMTRKGKQVTFYLVEPDSVGNPVVKKETQTIHNMDLSNATQFTLGYFKGYVDEFRLWTKCLTEDEIKENWDHLLVGNEKNLETYWTFDEGLSNQFFDYSRDGTVYNQHHGKIGPQNTKSETLTPAQLKLKAKTDKDGNYIIQGVPFSGEGTTYAIIPKLGIHSFNPTQHLRFVSSNSLVHNSTDFDDVSSFPVSGKIFYAGTNYPVEGVNFYVDGSACTHNGELIETDSEGNYKISVPIGDHFITVAKNGHVFANEGRFPPDPLGTDTCYTFIHEEKLLDFQDVTLVNLTGRVVGGDIQGDKQVGFGLSTNNIGTVQLVLTPTADYELNVVKSLNAAGTAFSIDPNPDELPVASATPAINSNSWRDSGNNDKKIIIQTDPLTGEFSAMVPPLEYKIESMTVLNSSPTLSVGNPMTINLTDPTVTYTDTLYSDDGKSYKTYDYHTMLNQTYHSEAQFNVAQKGRTDGSFGIQSYKFTDELGEVLVDDIYTVNGQNVEYNYYDSPVFIEGDSYTFELEGYEEYTNADNSKVDRVPLVGSVVTIANALSASQAVRIDNGATEDLKENQLELNDAGKATYKWTAGLPNISDPYSRTISMTYEVEGVPVQWKQNGQSSLKGIILGCLPTGNNFVTCGPDKVSMVLRDPPGTNSFTEWKTGASTTTTTLTGSTFNQNNSASFKHRFGFKKTLGIGAGLITTIESIEEVNDLEVGVKQEYQNESSESITQTTSVTKTISTSAAPEYVGAQGDVYIGNSTNILVGKVRSVDFRRVPGTDKADISLEDIIQTGIEFGTMFMYTQNYIENVLIPNYKLMLKKFLKPATQEEINNYVNNNNYSVYLTTLSSDDEHFGEENTYSWFKPALPGTYSDSVLWVSQQIKTWKDRMADNEREKVLSYAERSKYLVGDNLSFDSGTTYNYEVSLENDTTTTRDWSIKGGLFIDDTWGLAISSFGFQVHLTDETIGGEHHTSDSTRVETTTFSYTLAEDGDDDALSVDVLKYGNFGPIFHTRAGQTCCPYEGKEVTKFYEPGKHILMEATMQIEKPKIYVDVNELTDIPCGSPANYTLRLTNQSEIDEDVYYRLLVDDETNPDGANLMIDGMPITDSRIIKIPAGTTVTKALQLVQTNTSILDYEDIGLVLASQCQFDPTSTWDVIADTVKITAHFTPSSSPVTLALSNSTMNTETGTDLELTIKDFDRNYNNLKAFRLQYKKQGDKDWTQLKEYVLNDDDFKPNTNEKLPAKGATVSFTKDMANFSDGDYWFRCVSASTHGGKEVYRYSDELALVKDMQKPRPMGQPEPTDGVLDIGDELSITFNEAFLKGELNKEMNFVITGVLNGSEVEHETALSLVGNDSESCSAETEASINLANKDFSIDAWVNITSAGTLLIHGKSDNKLTVGTNADNKLVVKIGSNTYTSANTVPTGKWSFLTLSLTADGKLSATVAQDATETPLFNEMPVATYAGNGPLSVGGGSAAAIHELLLWDEAHDMTTALLNRSVRKNPSTRHLIGYWKMDEGEGTSIRDYARSRNMTMADETWYINNKNKAISLDGQSFVAINAGELPTTAYDDYTVEFWMCGGQQTGEAQLVQMGDIALSVNAEGNLQLKGKDASSTTVQPNSEFVVSNSKLTNNAWHHIALNVLRQGAASVYVDGKRCLTTNAMNVGSIATDRMIVGARRISNYEDGNAVPISYTFDHAFTGQIDEIRLWGATMNGDMLTKNRKVRFTGSEPGLMAYYPFETQRLDLNTNQIGTIGISDDLTDSGHKAERYALPAANSAMPNPSSQLELNYVDNAPALRAKPIETNVSFNYVASDEKVVIDIDEDPATIEGCTLNFTVKRVRDVNGNYSDPTTWSAFVNRNELVWADDALSVTQHVETGSSVTATIVNKGGKQQMWTLDGMPAWLTASAEYGTTNPKSESTVTFTVSPSTPIGKYEETIYLKGNDGIETPLTINVKVTGDEPLWSVNVGDYEESMNLIGALDILGVPSEDEDDLVGAFINDECRGVAHPKYIKKYDSYFVTMDIYNNGNNDESEVEFKVYDASTGIIYPVVTTSEPVEWEANSFLGRYKTPVSISATDMIEQSIDLENGWNWMSLGVTPETFTVPVVFEKANGKVLTVKSQSNGTITYSNGQWVAKPTNLGMNNQEMYVVKTSEPLTLTVTGHRVKPADVPITVKYGWNWLGYNGMKTASLTEALSGLGPQDGDIIKGQRGVAYFDDSEWIGSLSTLVPGLGYKIQSEVSNDRTFSYPSTTSVAGARRAMPDSQLSTLNAQTSTFTPVDYSNYPANMVLIAQVVADGQPVSGLELGVFAGEECREAAVTDERGLVYITIPGDENCELTFRVSDGNSQLSTLNAQITYETDAVIGTPKAPFIINLDNATGIADNIRETINNSGDVYDLQGRKLSNSQLSNGKIRKGVYIVNGQKQVK